MDVVIGRAPLATFPFTRKEDARLDISPKRRERFDRQADNRPNLNVIGKPAADIVGIAVRQQAVGQNDAESTARSEELNAAFKPKNLQRNIFPESGQSKLP